MSAPIGMPANGPVLLFGGPYGNLEATEAVFAEAGRRGIAGDHVICTGDVTAYCADPRATVDLIRSAGCHVVMGNCEEALATAAPDCGCGFSEKSVCASLSDRWFRLTDEDIDDDARAWFATLPRRLDLSIAGRRLAVVHGGVMRINRFVFGSQRRAMHDELETVGVDGIIGGHCGLPFTRIVGDRLWHNPGAVGLPANDGTPRVWFSVLTPRAGSIEVAHSALDYDHRRAATKMRERGWPVEYADALETGLWPSCDVLPAVERRERGLPLQERTLVWTPRRQAA